MADEIDDILRRTMKTLDDQVPSGYFEDLPQRTLGRLEVSLMHTGSDQEPATSSGTPVPPEEDSGLHDIRSLAQTTKQRISSRKIPNLASGDDDAVANSSSGWKAVALPEPAKMIALPDIADLPVKPRKLAEASAVEIPDVTPIGARVPKRPVAKRRNGMIAMVGVGFAAAAGVVLFVATRNKSEDVQRADTTSPALERSAGSASTPPPGRTVTPIAPQQIAADKVETTGTPKGEAVVGAAGSGAVADPTTTMDAGTQTGKDDPTSKDAPTSVKVTPTPSTKPVPTRGMTKTAPPSKTKSGKMIDTGKTDVVPTTKPEAKSDDEGKKPSKKAKAKDDEPSFDDLLKDAGETTKAPAKPKLDKTSLSADDFKHGMGTINGRATACYKGTPGTVSVRVAIGPDGHVQKVTVTGSFAGTPSGDCVAAAVKAATFAPWDGPPQSFGYSFLLSE